MARLASNLSANLRISGSGLLKVAVIDLTTPDGRACPLGAVIAEELTTRLFATGRFEVIERRQLQRILQEQQMSATDLLDPASAARLGHLVGTRGLVAGTIATAGRSYRINARIILVETAAVVAVGAADLDAMQSAQYGTCGAGTADASLCAQDDLILNGSFEAPRVAPGGWDVFNDIPGWTVTFGSGVEVQNRVAGDPYDGEQHVELDSHSNSNIAQRIRTKPQSAYILSVAFSPRPGNGSDDNAITVRWNGQVVAELTAQPTRGRTTWQTRALPVQANTEESVLELAAAGPSNGLGAYVDHVRLVEVCE